MALSTPEFVDVHVGSKVRLRRKAVGKSQQQMADAIRLTFQQVQKYERGSNRISASKLYQIAQSLQVPVDYFFEGLEQAHLGAEGQSELGARLFLKTTEGVELAKWFQQISARHRRGVLALVRSLDDTHS